MIEIQNGLQFNAIKNISLEQQIINGVPMVSIMVGDMSFGEIAGTMSVTNGFAYIYDSKGDLVAVF